MSESAASVIRAARLRAAMTQNELAASARVSQSVISAYESGAREPSLAMVRKLVTAAGFVLELTVSESEGSSPLRRTVELNRLALVRALRRHGARNVRLFGSVATGHDGPASDVDLLVDVGPEVGLFALGLMRSDAERILQVAVDIVPANGLKPDVAERIRSEAIAL